MILTLDQIAQRIPRIECKRLCDDFCGPIGMSASEFDRILRYRRDRPIPGAFRTEAGMMGIYSKCVTCPLLTDEGLCSVYPVRPLVCRVFGVLDEMPCPHGCRPERTISKAEFSALLLMAGIIGEPMTELEAREAVRKVPALLAYGDPYRSRLKPGTGWVVPMRRGQRP